MTITMQHALCPVCLFIPVKSKFCTNYELRIGVELWGFFHKEGKTRFINIIHISQNRLPWGWNVYGHLNLCIHINSSVNLMRFLRVWILLIKFLNVYVDVYTIQAFLVLFIAMSTHTAVSRNKAKMFTHSFSYSSPCRSYTLSVASTMYALSYVTSFTIPIPDCVILVVSNRTRNWSTFNQCWRIPTFFVCTTSFLHPFVMDL